MNTFLINMFSKLKKSCFYPQEKDQRVDLRIRFARRSAEEGFTLLEVIVAITLITIGIAASLLLITRTIGAMAVSSSQLIAAYLAQEGIEIVRNIRDTNWLEQATNPGNLWDEGLNTPECNAGCEADYITGSAGDSNPLDPILSSYGTGRFLCIDPNGVYRYLDPCTAPNIQSKFKRKITITAPATDTLTVTVLVEWQEKGRTHSQIAQANLYNWK